ncbi:PDZ domain-containing protein [Chungangia koreensis]|uniref:PDZ domain-containing protein n=1 Tax=Chungangia koreensis TaxID=752657 RepID=A0ABV8X4G7_9LACT
MFSEILLEVLKGIGRFFLNPLTYVVVLFAVLLGYVRVKRERKFFRRRILYGWTELQRLVADGWIPSILLSVLIFAAGLTVTEEWLALFTVIALLVTISFLYKAGSPVYFTAIALAILWALHTYGNEIEFWNWTFGGTFNNGLFASVAILSGLFLLAEAFLVKNHTADFASPLMKKSARGMNAAVFKVKRLWLLPVLFVVPGDAIASYAPYWPQITIGGEAFALVLAPLVIGFEQTARHSYPEDLFPLVAKRLNWLGIAVTVFGIGAIGIPLLGVVAIAIGVIGRIVITVMTHLQEKAGKIAGAPESAGVKIVGVLPGSPADKMGLKVGECIRKVNGQAVSNENELYEAIQINAAHCRLEVLDRSGEVRLRQHVIYRHDHYRLGLLVVQ